MRALGAQCGELGLAAFGLDAPLVAKARTFLRDVYDHVVRVHDTLEGLRDEVAGARDAYLSMVSVRMNSVVKGLTLVATLTLPIIFVSGIYGMNFQHMPELAWMEGYPMALGLMFFSALIPFLYFRHKGWL